MRMARLISIVPSSSWCCGECGELMNALPVTPGVPTFRCLKSSCKQFNIRIPIPGALLVEVANE